MIIVFVRVFMGVVPMMVVMMMRGEELFDDIDEEKSTDKCIDREFGLFESFRKYVHECDR